MLQWDIVDNVDGYKLFSTTVETDASGNENTAYDYAHPITTESYPDGGIPNNVTEMEVDLPGESDKIIKYAFVARAFRGDNESEDSNEVYYTVDRILPDAPFNIEGNYDELNSIITLTWEQIESNIEVAYWKIFYRIKDDNATGDWIQVGMVEKNSEMKLTGAFTAVAIDEVKDVDFSVVAYRSNEVFSHNSEVLTLHIDRTIVHPVKNLKIVAEIPVQ